MGTVSLGMSTSIKRAPVQKGRAHVRFEGRRFRCLSRHAASELCSICVLYAQDEWEEWVACGEGLKPHTATRPTSFTAVLVNWGLVLALRDIEGARDDPCTGSIMS